VLRQVGGDRPGEMAAHRFPNSPHVTSQEVLNTAVDRTAAACSGRRIVAAQDTTEINFQRTIPRAQRSQTSGRWEDAGILLPCDGDG
jgi:hypothetical protein